MNEIKEVRFEDDSFLLPFMCSTKNALKILRLYLLIYIKHKGTIELWSNELTKAREKI